MYKYMYLLLVVGFVVPLTQVRAPIQATQLHLSTSSNPQANSPTSVESWENPWSELMQMRNTSKDLQYLGSTMARATGRLVLVQILLTNMEGLASATTLANKLMR